MTDTIFPGRRVARPSLARLAFPLCLTALLAAGCSESGGDGGDGNPPLFQTPSNDAPPPQIQSTGIGGLLSSGPTIEMPPVQDPATEGPVVQGPPVQGPPVQGPITEAPPIEGPTTEGPPLQGPFTEGPTTEGPPVQGPITEGPTTEGPITEGPIVEAPPVASGDPLQALFGTVSFEWAFAADSQRFAQTIRYGQNNVQTDEDGSTLLIAVNQGEFPAFACGHLEDALYVCFGIGEAEDVTLFFFELDSAGNGRGIFEYCGTGSEIDTCITNLQNDPDGPVTVSVQAGGVAIASRSADRDVVTDDLSAWMGGLDQADGADTGDAPGDALPAGTGELFRELEALACDVGEHCL